MNEQIIKIYNDYINTDEYIQTPEIQTTIKRDSIFQQYEKVMRKHFSNPEYTEICDTVIERTCADAETGFILGFKYAAKLMVDIYWRNEKE